MTMLSALFCVTADMVDSERLIEAGVLYEVHSKLAVSGMVSIARTAPFYLYVPCTMGVISIVRTQPIPGRDLGGCIALSDRAFMVTGWFVGLRRLLGAD